jgi:signal transduction histidine kinase
MRILDTHILKLRRDDHMAVMARRLRFPPDLEDAFQRDYFENTVRMSRIAALITIFIVIVHGLLDYWTIPTNYHLAWLIRATIMVPGVGITLLLSYAPGIRKVFQGLMAACATLIGVGICLMIMIARPGELAFTIYFSARLLVLGGFFVAQLQFRYVLVSSLVILAAYELCTIFSQGLLTSPEGRVLFLFGNFMYITALVFAGIAGYTIEYYRRRDFLQRHELLHQNVELKAYAHTVAHDLKVPLISMVGYAEMAREYHRDEPAETLERQLEAVVTGGMQMSAIVDDLLLLANARQMDDIETGPLDMTAVVDHALMRVETITLESDAAVVKPENWPAARGYAPWVEGVWANLISNAMKYGGEPPRVELGADTQPDGMVRFWVRDNGPGLSEEDQARLFVEFSRLDEACTNGHGLGLSIVKRIVRKLGGQVGIEGAPGEGSTFWFTLPAPD